MKAGWRCATRDGRSGSRKTEAKLGSESKSPATWSGGGGGLASGRAYFIILYIIFCRALSFV